MNSHSAEVIIVGGGPVGMGLAIELGQRGVPTLVLERYPQPQPIPKGQNLTQRTMEHFHFWGCEKAVRAARTIPQSYGIGGLTAYGTLLSNYHYDWLQRELVRPYYFTDNERLPQFATEAVLRARASELPSVQLLYGWDATAINQDKDSVDLTAFERLGGAQCTISGQYLVGCDGSRSIVREQAQITQTFSDHDRLMALLVFRSSELSRLLERYPGKSFYNVLHPSLEGYWLFLGRVGLDDDWFFHAPVPEEARDGNFDFPNYLREAVGAPFDVSIEHVGFWDLRFAIADSYRASRVFIAGDAAHSHPPYGGYGINTGFEDARNLGWKLAATLQNWGGPSLLDSYNEERRGVFKSTADDFIEKAINQDREFLERFNPDDDPVAFEEEWTKRGSGAREEIDNFEPNYRGSQIVWGTLDGQCSARGQHRTEARAGHHLAPHSLSDGSNVYEKLGAELTLLAYGADDAIVAAFVAAARHRHVGLTVVRDSPTDDRAALGAQLVLVRPDQFVAWTGNDPVADAQDVLDRSLGWNSTAPTFAEPASVTVSD